MDRFFRLDLDQSSALGAIPDGAYDSVICSHVLEHLKDPQRVAAELAGKLSPGGSLYLETPSLRSCRLPSVKSSRWVRGCLNFRDDETHREPVDLRPIAEALRSAGLAVQGPSVARLWRRVALLPLYVVATLVTKGFVPASLLWDATGCAECLTAVRPSRENRRA
jgi:hypothetical protein